MSLDKDAALSDHFTLKIHLLCDSSCADFNVNVFKKIFSKTSYSVNVVSLLQEQVETSSKLISLNNFFSKIPTPCLFYDIVFESAAPAPPKRVKTSLLTKHLHQSIVFNINFLQGDPSPGRYQKRNGSLSDLNHMINEELSIFQHNVYLDKNNGSRCIQFLDTSTTLVGETIVMSVIQRIVHRAIYCYIVNLMSHISNFKRHLIVEENKKLGGVQMSSKEKEIFCYVRKKIGDFYLFLGAPLFSLQMYSEIQEIMWKNSNSSWSAFCQESEAAAIYFYFLYIEQNTQENETNCLSSTGDTFLHCKNISAELERIVCDTSKFWTLYLPGNSKATKSHLVDFLHDTTLINASPLVPLHRHFEEMSNFVSSTFKNKKESLEIFGLILIKLKEAFHEYDKLGSKGLFWRLELLLKMMRLLVKTFNKKIILTRILCKVVDDLQQTSHFHQQEMYSALANILLPCQMYRHYSFLIFQNVHLQIKQCVTLYSLQQLCDTISYLYLQDVLIYRMNKCVDQNILSNCKTMDLQLSSLNDVFVFTAPMNSITLLLSSKYFHKNLTRFNFYQQHLKKIKIYQNDACHLFWPCLQVCVLKTLIILYTTLQQYEQAAFIVYTLLIKCHSVFNFKNTSTCLHLLHQLSQQMHEPLKLPVSLVVSSLNTSQVVKKNKREPEKNLTLTKKTLSFYGGVTQGSCPPLPTLCHIQVCQLKRGYWYQNSGQDYFHTFCETQLEETDFVNSTLKKSVVSQPFPCTNSHLMTFKTNYTNSMRSNSQVQQECVWFVGEPVVVELTVRSSLNVPLHIDAVHIQTLGAPLETKDVTLTLQPFSEKCTLQTESTLLK
ncbi:uncharacterized protein LOC128884458 [Hylaeus volcanicus]|uniref:uncharacterized protein LOC128884458 n=1 Tax=Hylaeus volcanicus TaxID=313075 RepID=UPI0023B78D69|nr:uncharacterized protein LOC128884458 [Hylaeus volcanicus]